MKKIVLSIFVFLAMCCFIFMMGINTKAFDSSTFVMAGGAQMRTTGEHQGLKFSASVDNLSGTTEHGFFVIKGNVSRAKFVTALSDGYVSGEKIDGNKLVKKVVDGVDTEFNLVVFDIDTLERQTQDISVIAYVFDGSSYTLATTAVKRNLMDVARAAYNNRAENAETEGDLVQTVMASSRIKVTHSDSSVNYYGDFDNFSIAEGDTLDLTKGTYTQTLTIDVNNVTIKGNNYERNGHGERKEESNLTNGIDISGSNVKIDGIKISGAKKIYISSDISTLKLYNIYSTATGDTATGVSRTAVIDSGSAINGLELKGIYATLTGAASRSCFSFTGTTTNLDVENCYLDNGATSYTLTEAIRANKLAGTVNISNNTFIWSTSNFSILIGNESSSATVIDFKNNVLRGSASGQMAGVAIRHNPAIDVNIVHNSFDYMEDAGTFDLKNGSGSANVFIAYNNFKSNTKYNCSNVTGNVIYKQNYYAAAQTLVTSDHGVIANEDDLATKYAKYVTPEVAGTITYNLDGGTNGVSAPTNYNLYSQITLPTPTKEEYSFLGWTLVAESSDYITKMPINQTGDVTLYAHWAELQTNFAVADYDKDVLNSVVPDIIVNSSFTNRKYVLTNATLDSGYASRYYRYGEKAFATIAEAIAAASADDVIYVFAGTYSNALTISTKVTLISPNYNVSAKVNHDRTNKAIISGEILITADGTIINGFDCQGDANIGIRADNIQLLCLAITPNNTRKCSYQNRQGLIADYRLSDSDTNYITNLVIKDSYLLSPTTTVSYTLEAMSFEQIDGLTLDNNYISNVGTTKGDAWGEGIMIYRAKGNFVITSNEFHYYQRGWLLRIGEFSTNCPSMLFQDNIFAGRGNTYQTCTIGILNCSATTVIDIIGNQFMNVEPSTITLGTKSNDNAICRVKYNSYDDSQEYKFPYGTSHTTCDYNYYGSTNADGNAYGGKGVDENEFASFDSMRAGYVDYLINLIGEVAYTSACKEKINHARSIYDGLTDAQKLLVSDYSTLTTAESTYASLAS